MWINIDERAPEAIFQQIVHQVKRLAATGALKPDDPLPSIRELAVRLGVNPNTVARGYRILEEDGLIQVRRGIGAFVASPLPDSELKQFRDEEIAGRVHDLVSTARQFQVPQKTVVTKVKQAFDEGGDA